MDDRVTCPHRFRLASPEDAAYIVSSWLESWHAGCPMMRRVRFSHYKPHARAMMQRLMARSVVMMACDPEDATHLLGYAVGEPAADGALLHYV
jgi:hypothetical protein